MWKNKQYLIITIIIMLSILQSNAIDPYMTACKLIQTFIILKLQF
jgi:hypothetical protein